MEKKKLVKTKTECICSEESDVSLNVGKSETNTVSTYEDEGSDINILEKTILYNPKKCICTKPDRGKTRHHVSWVDEESSSECVCEIINKPQPPVFDNTPSLIVLPSRDTPTTSAAPEEDQKKKKSFMETLKNLVTCACLAKPRKSVELEPEVEGPELETGDSGVISFLGRTYQPSSETIDTSDDWKKEPLVLVDDPQFTTPKRKPKPVIPNAPPRKKKSKEPIECQCGDETPSEDGSKSSSGISVRASKVKCKCAEPDITPSGHLLPATKCVCGQEIESNASLASGYTLASTASKPSWSYPSDRSEELIRQIDYQRPSQYSYRQYDAPLQTYGREVMPSYSMSSGMSYGNSNQFMVEEDDDISQELVLRDTGSRYRNAPSVPSFISEASAGGPSQPTIYRRLLRRFWLESLLYREPYPPPPLPRPIENVPSYSYSTAQVPDTVSLYRPTLAESQTKKPAPKSKEKLCKCSKKQLALVPSKEKQKAKAEKPAKVEKPKTENTKSCKCTKKSSDTKKSKEDIQNQQRDVELDCHCLEVLYMSKASSRKEAKVLSKSPSEPSGPSKDQTSIESKKTPEKIPTIVVEPPKEKEAPAADQTSSKAKKTPQNIPTIPVEPPKEKEATDQSSSKAKKTPQKIPTIIVEPPKEKEAPAADENENSSSNDSIVTVIDTHALTVPKVDTRKEARPGEDKKKENQDQQEAGSSSQVTPPPIEENASGWWDRSKHLIIGSTVVGATALGAYQYFKE